MTGRPTQPGMPLVRRPIRGDWWMCGNGTEASACCVSARFFLLQPTPAIGSRPQLHASPGAGALVASLLPRSSLFLFHPSIARSPDLSIHWHSVPVSHCCPEAAGPEFPRDRVAAVVAVLTLSKPPPLPQTDHLALRDRQPFSLASRDRTVASRPLLSCAQLH